MTLPEKHADLANLRRAAERHLRERLSEAMALPSDPQKLMHELQVHQIELEMQNVELQEARAEAEAALERYTQLYDHAPVGYFSLDQVGAILQLNLAGAALLGGERSRLVGRAFRQFIEPLERPAFSAFLARVLTRKGRHHCELTLRAAAPQGQPIYVRLEAMADAGGRNFSLVAMDISDRRAAEESLQKSEARHRQALASAERANLAKSRFLANTSHELRAPLTQLIVLAHLLGNNLEGNLSSEQVNYAQMIAELGSDLRQIVDDLLDLADIETGKLTAENLPVTCPDLLADIQRIYRAKAKRKGLEFGVTVEADVPAVIFTDPVRLQQILRSLLGNAVKFTQAGSVTLHIRRADTSPLPEPAIAFEVIDTGIGIPIREQQSIFQLFHPADGDSYYTFDSAGLGLPIAHELATLLGGDLELASTLGEGSTFTLYLPLEREAAGKSSA